MSFNKSRNKHQNRHTDRNRDRHRNKEERIPLGVKVYYTGTSEEQRTEDLEKALSKFKKIINKEGFIIELRERASYKSPGRKRYEKHRKWLYNLKLNKDKTQKVSDRKTKNKRGSKNDRHTKTKLSH